MTTPSSPAADADAGERPAPTFDVLPLSPEVKETLAEIGYTHPTPVQVAVWEPATRGRDAMVQARTGTGKTAAFGLPIVDHIVRRSANHVQVLVLCPTRELAVQVAGEIERLGKRKNIRVAAVYGGAPMQRQIDAIEGGAQVIVGTPGRVLDHLRRGTLSPKGVRLLVLDECDEMLSMGFERELSAILEQLPAGRQTLLFSATVPPDIDRIARTKLSNPEIITLSGDHIGALEIDHYVYMVAGDKLNGLVRILEVENPESAIVFCNTRDETERVAQAISKQGFDADWLNGDLPQSEREQVMSATREGRLRFLVATDVAARGIDISHLTHVINFDFPQETAAYVHRTGRTGRAGRTGTAISLITPRDIGGLYFLRLQYKIRPIEKQIPTEGELKTRAEADVVALLAEAFIAKGTHPDDLALARRILSHDEREAILAGLLRDHLGARPTVQEEAGAARRAVVQKPKRAAAPAPAQAAPGQAAPAQAAPAPRAEDEASKHRALPADERGGGRDRDFGRGDRRGRSRRDEPAGARRDEATRRDESAGARRDEPTGARRDEPTGARREETPTAAKPSQQSASQLSARAPAPAPTYPSPQTLSPPSSHSSAQPSTQPSALTSTEPAPTVTVTLPAPIVTDAPLPAAPSASPSESTPAETKPAAPAAPSAESATTQEVPAPRKTPDEAPFAKNDRPSDPRRRDQRSDAPRGASSDQSTGRRSEGRSRDDIRGSSSPVDRAAIPGRSLRGASERRAPIGQGRAAPPPLIRHADFVTWQPPEEEGDDEPILGDIHAKRPSPSADERREPDASFVEGRSSRSETQGIPEPIDMDLVEIYINVGRRDGARASDFQRVLEERAGIARGGVQRIRVRERNAFVSVRKEDLAKALAALSGATIAGRVAMAEQARERGEEPPVGGSQGTG